MNRSRLLPLILVAALVVGGSLRFASRGQDDARPAGADRRGLPPQVAGKGGLGIEEALLRPFEMPFAHETTLDAAAKHLQNALSAPVVLDLAALKRLELTPESTVKLELRGVRLKTGLKLLLDQVEMTYKTVPEDNLLVLTDAQGAEDPTTRVLAELRAIRRDLSDLQAAFDDLNNSIIPVEEAGPALRRPTIIEDMPAEKREVEEPPARSRPGL